LAKVSKRVLITGIEGFTGKHLQKYLSDRGFVVYGTSVFDIEDSNIYQVDITNSSKFAQVISEVNPDYIIHLAAISSPAHKDISAIYKINTIATIDMLDIVAKTLPNIKKVIIASSAAVYGNLGVEVLHEDLCPKPANHYGASKYSSETLSYRFDSNFPLIRVRPFNYTGVGQSNNFVIPKIVNHFKEHKESIELGNIDVIREFNDVEYACEVYYRLLSNDIASTTLNLCSGRGIKLVDVLKMMESIAGYKIKVVQNPDFMRRDEIPKLIGSTKKLFATIKEVKQVPFKETLTKMYEAK